MREKLAMPDAAAGRIFQGMSTLSLCPVQAMAAYPEQVIFAGLTCYRDAKQHSAPHFRGVVGAARDSHSMSPDAEAADDKRVRYGEAKGPGRLNSGFARALSVEEPGRSRSPAEPFRSGAAFLL